MTVMVLVVAFFLPFRIAELRYCKEKRLRRGLE